MKRALLFVVLIGCTSDPHEVEECGFEWGANAGKPCESACVHRPSNTGDGCNSMLPNGLTFGCFATFTSDDVQGCCHKLDDDSVAFLACNE